MRVIGGFLGAWPGAVRTTASDTFSGVTEYPAGTFASRSRCSIIHPYSCLATISSGGRLRFLATSSRFLSLRSLATFGSRSSMSFWSLAASASLAWSGL